MTDDIVIWGTGMIGNIAYHYYKDRNPIVCFIDNDNQKWGHTLNGIEICSPDILQNREVTVVLALKNGVDDVKDQLRRKYDIRYPVLFQVNEKKDLIENRLEEIQENSCIVLFSGGLGNQMFQYAFAKCMEIRGKEILADISTNFSTKKFQLTNTFKNISLKICTDRQKEKLVWMNLKREGAKQFLIYKEKNIYDVEKQKADMSLLNNSGGIFYGLYQTYKFAEQVRELLLNDFKFNIKRENKLVMIYQNIIAKNVVGVHIRRGDYLDLSNKWKYGNICTEQYYKRAISYIREKVDNCIFAFFSNDMAWVKEYYKMDDAIYIEATMFDDYQDWYDMYLMSVCKHNIIANSTFSWWGAWLNQNTSKIVVAPKRWVNQCEYLDIYPESWITL